MANNLTQKEVDMISELLTFEESLIKKANVYSKNITDTKISDSFKTISENGKTRFESLINQL